MKPGIDYQCLAMKLGYIKVEPCKGKNCPMYDETDCEVISTNGTLD